MENGKLQVASGKWIIAHCFAGLERGIISFFESKVKEVRHHFEVAGCRYLIIDHRVALV